MNVRTPRRGVARILLAFGTTLGVTLGAVALTATPASAHDATITAQSACDGTVSYTVTSWMGTTPESRTNSDVEVDASTDGGTTWSTIGSGAFAAPDFAFAGTWPAGTPLPPSVELRAHTVANWGDGVAGGQYTAPYSVALPTDCQPVTQPKASIDHDCSGYDATLDNSASTVAATYDVVVNGVTTAVTVPAGAVQHHTGSIQPGRATTIAVSVAGTTLATATQDVCALPAAARPTATLTGDCSGITATLTNTAGTAAAVFTVLRHSPAGAAATTRHYTVRAGASQTLPKLRRHGAHTERVVLIAPGMKTMSKTVGAGCSHHGQATGSNTDVNAPTATGSTSSAAVTQGVPTAVEAGEAMTSATAASPAASPRDDQPSRGWLLAASVTLLLAGVGLLTGSLRRQRS